MAARAVISAEPVARWLARSVGLPRWAPRRARSDGADEGGLPREAPPTRARSDGADEGGLPREAPTRARSDGEASGQLPRYVLYDQGETSSGMW